MSRARSAPWQLVLAFTAGAAVGVSCVDFQGQLDECYRQEGPCAPVDAGVCAAPRSSCDAGCVDLAADENNCGQCGKTCGQGEVCFAGQCHGASCADRACPAGSVCINEGCVPKACVDTHCTAVTTCVNGACDPRACGASTCAEGAACLDGGCVDSACQGQRCPDGGACQAGRCDGLTPCTDGLLDPGETDVDCGGACHACVGGKSCRLGSDCVSGSCLDGGVCSASCVQGARCTGNPGAPCRVGYSTCLDGVTTCLDGLNAADGLGCGTDQVCAGGQCVACAAGSSCSSNQSACAVGVLDCTGRPVCTNGPQRDAGATCGNEQVCTSGGQCTFCNQGAACTANPSAPCKQGVVDCAGGVLRCLDGLAAPQGTMCGVDKVCSGGACLSCVTGTVCYGNPGGACMRGVTACGSTFGCLDSTPVGAGTSCGSGLVCSGDGGCVACAAGTGCTTNPGAPCKTGVVECSTGAPRCVDLQNSAPGLSCGTNKVCDGNGACAPCTAGTSCSTNPSTCRLGVTSCASGSSQCIDGAVKSGGTSCGSGLVCDGNGFCGPCVAGQGCSGNPDVCDRGVTSCSTGQARCVDGAALDAGVACGVNQVCTGGGSCVACTAGQSCGTNPNPCYTGATSCATGAQTCVDGSRRPTGASCGTDQVCTAAGACVGCVANLACTTNPNAACKTGITSCATGAQTCVDYANKGAGTGCGTDLVCDGNGSCVGCAAGRVCSGNSNVCAQGVTSCATGAQTCANGAARDAGTGCGTNKVCNPSGLCADCTAGMPCTTNPGACFDGVTSCGTGVQLCVDGAPKTAGTGCLGGVCDGTGLCAKPCTLPWGGTLASGSSVTAYSTGMASCGGATCQGLSETRTCTDGTLSGSYQFEACAPASGCGCTLPWGGSISSGQSITAYQAATASCGASCVSEQRTCTNGTLSGSFLAQACSLATGCPCTTPWDAGLADGQMVSAYSTPAPSCGGSCAASSQARVCSNGTLSGTYTSPTCADPTGCACTLPWGGTVADGQTTTAYQAASVVCGASCQPQTRTCANGTLSGTYANQSCTVVGGMKGLGETCALGCECASGLCTGFYADGDGDGHGAGPTVNVCAASVGVAPSGYATNHDDCCDMDPNAYPAAPLAFSVATKCGGYDYDCDSLETPKYAAAFAGCTSSGLCVDTGAGTPCDSSGFVAGWGVADGGTFVAAGATVPACGQSGTLVSACGAVTDATCGGASYCSFSASSSAQPCK